LQRVTHVRTPSASTSDEVAALYARTCRPLIGLLTSIGGSRSEAEEVAQDAYVKALQQWPTIRSYDDPDAWVRTVAVRLLISRHRRATVATLGLRRLAAQARQDEPELTADSVATATALRRLPVPQRAAVILHYVLDLPLHDVAEHLHLPVGTVKSRLSRARAALAPLLRETEETKNV
jgi:RNA polymerase sigma-70 factor (ECF subfamily)